MDTKALVGINRFSIIFLGRRLKEPDKCFEWVWADADSLPEPLFLSVKNYLNKSTKTNSNTN